MTLRLGGEVHALEKGLEAGIGAERVEVEQRVEIDHQTVAFLGSLLQP